MALSSERRKQLLERTLPQRDATRKLLNDYLARTGLMLSDFARRINYSKMTLQLFNSGHYEKVASNDAAIRAAIHDFIDAHPIEPLTESDGRLYETENVRLVRNCFYEALDGRCAYYFRGAPGSQKTFVLQHLIAELNRAEISKNGHGRRAFYVYCREGIRPTSLMKRVAESAGSPSVGDADRILRNLRFDIGRRNVLFVFDEAQHLDISCLETLRELHDMPPHCGLLFAGSHELEKTFNRIDMEQWNSRLRKGAELPGISESEAAEIIRAELDLPEAKAAKLIESCYAKDLRKGREVRYISARMLFWSVQKLKAKQQAKVKGATA
jgi:DNA transposition AAA+ family ATPase